MPAKAPLAVAGIQLVEGAKSGSLAGGKSQSAGPVAAAGRYIAGGGPARHTAMQPLHVLSLASLALGFNLSGGRRPLEQRIPN